MKNIIVFILVAAVSFLIYVNFFESHHGHGGLESAHGGRVLEVGDHVAHLDYVHDADKGVVTIYVLDKEGTQPVMLSEVIKINVTSATKAEILTQAINAKEGKASTYTATHEALKDFHLEGQIELKLNDNMYSVTIPHDHEH